MKKIEFLKWKEYSEFNYCCGKLYLNVDGKEWVSEGLGCLNHSFGCYIGENGQEFFVKGCWSLNDGFFNDFNEDEKKVILNLVNKNMKAKCCGGCL